MDQETRQQGQVEGVVEIVGIVRTADHRPPFSPGSSDTTRREWKRRIQESRQTTTDDATNGKLIQAANVDDSENLAQSIIMEKAVATKEKKPWKSCAGREKFKARFREKWGADHFLFRLVTTMAGDVKLLLTFSFAETLIQ